jgi:hypothetical protein
MIEHQSGQAIDIRAEDLDFDRLPRIRPQRSQAVKAHGRQFASRRFPQAGASTENQNYRKRDELPHDASERSELSGPP